MTTKKSMSIFSIIGIGTKLYCRNIFLLSAPVVAPVLGIILGMFLAIYLPIHFVSNYELICEKYSFFKEFWVYVTAVVVTCLPGLVIFKFGFWDYMLKLVSLNLFVDDIIKQKLLKHHSQYTKIISLRTKDYLAMLFIWCLIIIMGLAIPVIVKQTNSDVWFSMILFIVLMVLAILLLTILSIYLSLSFQVFAFEPALSPMETLEKSFKLVANNFWRLVIMILFLSIIVSGIIPQMIAIILDVLMLKATVAEPFAKFLNNFFLTFPNVQVIVDGILQTMNTDIAQFMLEAPKQLAFLLISTIISLFMMPLGTCYYVLFYKDVKHNHDATLIKEEPEDTEEKPAKKSSKKTSGKKK